MPKFLEKQLQAEYGPTSATPYKIMNKLGYMHGSKETSAGRAAQAKHDAKVGSARKAPAASGHPHKNLGKYLHKAKGR